MNLSVTSRAPVNDGAPARRASVLSAGRSFDGAPMDTAAVTETYLLYVIMPLWLLSGIADWACHRASRIEWTSGVKESFIHLLMLAEVSIPVLLGAFFEINALVIAVMLCAWLLHEVTAYWDVSYASRTREVTAFEQRVHDYLGAIPFMALSFILVLHWPQLLALFGMGPEPLRLSLTWKQPPLPTSYVVGLLGAIVLLDAVPFIEELWRTWRAQIAQRASHSPLKNRRP